MEKALVYSLEYYQKTIDADFASGSDDISYEIENFKKYLENQASMIKLESQFQWLSEDYKHKHNHARLHNSSNIEVLLQELMGYLYLQDALAYNNLLYGTYDMGRFVEHGLALSKILAFGRIDWAEDLYRLGKESIIAKKHIDGDLTSKTLFIYPQRMGVFSMELMAQRAGEVIDWEAAEVVNIDAFYLQAAREAYHTEDEGLLMEWLMAMANAHVIISETDDPDEEFLDGHEFTNEPLEHLWPYEIHALLKLRREAGRSTIDLKEIDHPLFQQPFAQLPESPTSVWQPRAELLEDDLLNKVFAKMAQDESHLSYLKEMVYQVPKTI